MQTGPVGFDAALAAGTSPTIVVEADVFGTTRDLVPMTSRIQIARELARDLPDLASAAAGSVAARATFDVDGYTDGAPNPLSSVDRLDWTSAPVRVSAGFAGLTVPVFTGTVREMNISELERQVQVSALDGADLLRAPLTLPQFGYGAFPDRTAAPLSNPTNLSAVVVAALHANGIRITPAPRAGCIFSVPGVGGSLAEVGRTFPYVEGARTIAYWGSDPLFAGVNTPGGWIPGPFGPAATARGQAYDAQPAAFPWVSGAKFSAEGYWYRDDLGPTGWVGLMRVFGTTSTGVRISWYLRYSAGTLDLVLTNYGTATSTTITTTPLTTVGWHHVAMQISATGDWALWLDGVNAASGTSALWSAGDGTNLTTVVTSGSPSQAVQIHGFAPGVAWDTPTAAWGFTPQADVEQSAVNLQYVPLVQDRISWEVLKEVAAVDMGAVGFDESGKFYFRSSLTLNAPTQRGAVASRTNLCQNPRALAALAGFGSMDPTKYASTKSTPITGHPQGITTASMCTNLDGTAILASLAGHWFPYPLAPIYFYGAWVLVTVAGYQAYWMTDGSPGAINLPAGTWTWVPSLTPHDSSIIAYSQLIIIKTTGSASPSDVAYVTGGMLEARADPCPDFFDGDIPDLLTTAYAWIGTPLASTSTSTPTTVGTISTDIAANLVGGTALAAVMSTVTAKVRPHAYIYGSLDKAGLWQAPCLLSEVPSFGPGTSTLLITAPRPVIIPDGVVDVWGSAATVTALADSQHVILLCTAADGTSGQVLSTDPYVPTASLRQIGPSTLVLTVVNPTATTLYAVIPTSWDSSGVSPWPFKGGAPGLLLSGWSTPIDADIPTLTISATDDAAASAFGSRAWALPDSQWRQDPTSTQTHVTALLSDLSSPRLLLEDVHTQWDPRWQLGDLVLVTDTAGRMPDQLARITAIDPTLALTEERRMTVKLGLRLIPPPPVTAAEYDARWAGSTAAEHDAAWAAARPGGVTAAQFDALPLRVSP